MQESVPLQRQTYSVAEAGQLLGLSRNSAYAAAKDGQIPTVRINGRILVPRRALERLLSGEQRSGQPS